MNKILGIDSTYSEAIRNRGRNMLISANLVAEIIEKIGQLEKGLAEALEWNWCDEDAPEETRKELLSMCMGGNKLIKPIDHAKCLALYLESNIGSKYSCLRDDLEDFIEEMKDK